MSARISKFVAVFFGFVSIATASSACPYGPDQCVFGFVWREAFPGDRVCVTGDRRATVATDNATRDQRRDINHPHPGACLFGYVWREAGPGDFVCVDGAERERVWAENKLAGSRRDPNCQLANTPPPNPVDTTAPSFVQVTLNFYRAADGLQVGSTVVPPQGITVNNVAPDRRFVVAATAGDSESGVARIFATGREYQYSCTDHQSDLAQHRTATMTPASDEEFAGAVASPPYATFRNAHFGGGPVAGPTGDGCVPSHERSTANFTITVNAANGNGMVTRYGPIVINYSGRRGVAAPGGWCGATTEALDCPANTSCQYRTFRVCEGASIFSRCDNLRDTFLTCQPG